MRLAGISTPIVVPVPPDPTLHDAINHLEAAHDVADVAVEEPWSVDVASLVGASQDAATAADLLSRAGRSELAGLAQDAASDLDSAAIALRDEEPEVAKTVVQARAADAEIALDQAFDGLGLAH